MALEMKISCDGGVRFRASARGHDVVCDQPLENGGTDEGMTPPELLLASLGTCAAYYAAEYLRVRKLSSEGLSVKVTAEKAQRPAHLKTFRVVLSVPGLEDQHHREGVIRATKSCLIHNTLSRPGEIGIELEDGNRRSDLAATNLTE